MGTALIFWDSCRKTIRLRGSSKYSVTLSVKAEEDDGLIRYLGQGGIATVFLGFIMQLIALLAGG
jgi:hypothetical protein